MLGFALSITLGMLYFLMDQYIYIYDPEWNGIFSNEEIIIDGKLIFLIGDSQVYSIDVDSISEELSVNEIDYEIYNLAVMSDTPTKRMNSMMHLVNLEPDVIIYGISMSYFEKSRDYKSEFFDHEFLEYLSNPNEFFRNFFSYVINSDLSEKFPTSPKDRMIQSIKYILRGPDYSTHPFINYNKNDILSQDEIISIYKDDTSFRGIDIDMNNEQFLVVNKMIETFESNGIKVLIFTSPYNELFFESVSEKDLVNFEYMIETISKKYNIKTLYLHEKFAKKEIWIDPYHVAVNENSRIYADEIKNWLLIELKK